MGIQSTVYINRADAIDMAIHIYAIRHRYIFEEMSDEEIEEYIDERFYNYNII